MSSLPMIDSRAAAHDLEQVQDVTLNRSILTLLVVTFDSSPTELNESLWRMGIY
jgi:hypothetical protein